MGVDDMQASSPRSLNCALRAELARCRQQTAGLVADIEATRAQVELAMEEEQLWRKKWRRLECNVVERRRVAGGHGLEQAHIDIGDFRDLENGGGRSDEARWTDTEAGNLEILAQQSRESSLRDSADIQLASARIKALAEIAGLS